MNGQQAIHPISGRDRASRPWRELGELRHLGPQLVGDGRKHRVDSSWANDALNAPTGKLASLLMKDPSTKGRELGQGFPENWTRRHEQLLALPGDMRRHSLVMLGFQINWLFAIAPDWTTANLLTVVNDEGNDGDALWDGILWAGRAPSRALYERLKPGFSRGPCHPYGVAPKPVSSAASC